MPDALRFTIAADLDAAGFTAAAARVREMGAAGGEAGRQLRTAGDAGATVGTKTAAGAKDAADKLSGLAKEAHGFTETLREGLLGGFNAGLGIGAAEKALEGLGEVFAKVKEAFAEGVRLNAELETETLGLAATLRSVEPEKYLSFESAKTAASAAIETIRAKAIELGQDSTSVIQSYSANISALAESGITDTGRQVQLVTALMSAAASKGITGVQALRDVIDILNGKAGNIVLAKELGLENSALKEAAASGTLYNLIIGKLTGYNEGLTEQASSFKGVSGSIAEVGRQLLQIGGEDLFTGLLGGLKTLRDTLKDPSLRTDAATLGEGLGNVAAILAKITANAIRSREAIVNAVKIPLIAEIISPAAAVVEAGREILGGLNKSAEDGVKIGAGRIELNRRLIDQADTEEKKALVRNSLARQLQNIEGQITASRADVGKDGLDTPITKDLRTQRIALQEELAGLDAKAGKHLVVASTQEHERKLTAEEVGRLTEANATLDAQAQKRASIADQAENLAEATTEAVRKAAELVGLDVSQVAALHGKGDAESASLGLNERQTLQLKEQLVQINLARDAEEKKLAALQKQRDLNIEAAQKTRTDLAPQIQKATADIIAAPAGSDAQIKAQGELARLRKEEAAASATELANRRGQIPELSAELDSVEHQIALLPQLADRTALDGEKAILLAKQRAEIIRTLLDPSTALAAASLADARTGYGSSINTRPAPAPAPGPEYAGKTGYGASAGNLPPPAGDPFGGSFGANANGYGASAAAVPASAEDSGAAAAKVAGEAVKAGGDAVKTALDSTLTPAAATLTTAAAALPGKLAPIVEGLGTLLTAQNEHTDLLAGLVKVNTTANADTARRLQQLADYVYANV